MNAEKILYDAACPLCRNLAALAARRGDGLTFEAWQDFQASPTARSALLEEQLNQPADRLRVYTAAGKLVEGEAAWRHLIERHRDLASLNWLAERVGLAAGMAKTLEGAGHLVRRLCRRCGR